MATYQTRPVVVEAEQYADEGVAPDIVLDEGGRLVDGVRWREGRRDRPLIFVKTRQGWMTAQLGDWIIKGVDGTFSVCTETVFRRTYDPVEES